MNVYKHRCRAVPGRKPCDLSWRITGPKFTKFFSDVERSSLAFILLTGIPMLPSMVECQCKQGAWFCQFWPIRTKNWLPWQCPLRDHKSNSRLTIYSRRPNNPENLIETGPAHPVMIGLHKGPIKKRKQQKQQHIIRPCWQGLVA